MRLFRDFGETSIESCILHAYPDISLPEHKHLFGLMPLTVIIGNYAIITDFMACNKPIFSTSNLLRRFPQRCGLWRILGVCEGGIPLQTFPSFLISPVTQRGKLWFVIKGCISYLFFQSYFQSSMPIDSSWMLPVTYNTAMSVGFLVHFI